MPLGPCPTDHRSGFYLLPQTRVPRESPLLWVTRRASGLLSHIPYTLLSHRPHPPSLREALHPQTFLLCPFLTCSLQNNPRGCQSCSLARDAHTVRPGADPEPSEGESECLLSGLALVGRGPKAQETINHCRARMVARWARAGLPLDLVGTWPNITAYEPLPHLARLSESCGNQASEQERDCPELLRLKVELEHELEPGLHRETYRSHVHHTSFSCVTEKCYQSWGNCWPPPARAS